MLQVSLAFHLDQGVRENVTRHAPVTIQQNSMTQTLTCMTALSTAAIVEFILYNNYHNNYVAGRVDAMHAFEIYCRAKYYIIPVYTYVRQDI